MPNLKLLDIIRKQEKKVPEIKKPPQKPQAIKFQQLTFGNALDSSSPNSNTAQNNNKKAGTKYERYVGSLYEAAGYSVIYNGANEGGHDLVRDLICTADDYFTVIVQCKYYLRRKSINVIEIFKFYGSVRDYAIKHPQETVKGAFWTTLDMQSNRCIEAYRAAINFGIEVYDGVFILE